MGEPLDEWLRVSHSRPGLIGLAGALGEDMLLSSVLRKDRPTIEGRDLRLGVAQI